MMNWDYTMNGWMGGWMWIPFVVIVALLILGAIAIVQGLFAGAPRDANDPLAIAARRFARSEITKDEYEAVRATLVHP